VGVLMARGERYKEPIALAGVNEIAPDLLIGSLARFQFLLHVRLKCTVEGTENGTK
jgi:hypothetical protein